MKRTPGPPRRPSRTTDSHDDATLLTTLEALLNVLPAVASPEKAPKLDAHLAGGLQRLRCPGEAPQARLCRTGSGARQTVAASHRHGRRRRRRYRRRGGLTVDRRRHPPATSPYLGDQLSPRGRRPHPSVLRPGPVVCRPVRPDDGLLLGRCPGPGGPRHRAADRQRRQDAAHRGLHPGCGRDRGRRAGLRPP